MATKQYPPRWLILAIFLFGGFFCWRIVQKVTEYQRVKSEIEQLRRKQQELQKQVELLEREKKWRQSEEFIRQQAREKLGLGAANEVVYLVATPTPTPPFASTKQKNFFSWLAWLRQRLGFK